MNFAFKRIIYALVFPVLFLPLAIFGQIGLPAGGGVPDIPSEIRGIVSEEDWVQLYCFEGKYRGGAAVAKFQALAELTDPLFAKLKELREQSGGAPLAMPDYHATARGLENDLNSACRQTRLENTQRILRDYINEADRLRREAHTDLRELLPKLQSELSGTFNRRADELKAQTEEKLRADSEKEAVERTGALESSIAADIERELAARAQSGEFGENPDIAALRKLGQDMGVLRRQTARGNLEKELTEKYARLAQEEETRVQKLLEKEADEVVRGLLTGNIDIYRDPAGLSDAILSVELQLTGAMDEIAQRLFEEQWQQFRARAIQKKKEVILAIVETRIEEGKNTILSYADDIREAREAGVNIPSSEEMVARLQSANQTLIDRLASQQYNTEEDIYLAVQELRVQFDEIRLALELSRQQAVPDVLSAIAMKIDGLQREGINIRVSGFSFSARNFNFETLWNLYQDESNRASRKCEAVNNYFNTLKRERNLPDYSIMRLNLPGEYWCDLPNTENRSLGYAWKNDKARGLESDFKAIFRLEDATEAKIAEFSRFNSQSGLQEILSYKKDLVQKYEEYRSAVLAFAEKYPLFFEYLFKTEQINFLSFSGY